MKPPMRCNKHAAPAVPVTKVIFAPGVSSIMKIANSPIKKTTAKLQKKQRIS